MSKHGTQRPQNTEEGIKKRFWIAPIVAAVLTACNTVSPTVPSQINPKALGLLEVTLDFSDEANPTGTANFKPVNSSPNGVQTRAISASGNTTSQIAIRRRSVSFIDDNELSVFGTQTRYVRGTFDIANFIPTAFNNLNFMATSLNTQLGTMFSSLKDGAEVLIPATDTLPGGELTYRGLKPAHGMRLAADGGVEVDPNSADMQVFTPAEASTVQSALNATYPGLQVLEYGYTARSIPASSFSRNISTTPTSVDCSSTLTSPPNGFTFVTNNTSCFTGRVTFAFKFARKPVRNQNPFVFSFVFVVSDETTPTSTQSLNEQNQIGQTSLEQVLGLNLPSGEQRRIRTLPGSGVFGYPNPITSGVQREMLCNVKTAVATTTPVLPADYLSTKPGLTSFIPNPNTMFASTGSSILTSFCDNMNVPTSSSLVINGSQTGRHSSSNGVYSGAGSSLFYAPSAAFKPGEEVEVSLTAGLTRVSDTLPLNPIVYRFRTATALEGAAGFTPKTDYPTGSGPTALTSGDFNGDGKLDQAAINYSSNTVSVLLGTGTGSFDPKTDYPTGTGPNGIISGDFNGDGKLDLAVTHYSSNTVSVLLGTGTGSLNPKTDYPTGTGPNFLTSGDFNGDGKLDLAVTNFGTSSVSVLLGTGTGSFNSKTDFPTGTNPFALTSGDFNGDGKLDLVVANYSSNTVSVLLGSGTGSFNPKTDYPTGSSPNFLTSGDFNGDGKLDLAVANYSSNTVSVLLGTGTGSFNPKTDFPTGTEPNGIISGDFNGDGKLDLAATNYSSNTVSVLLGTGTGSFNPKTDYPTSSGPYASTSGDFNGDGRLDLAAPNSSSDTLSIFLKP